MIKKAAHAFLEQIFAKMHENEIHLKNHWNIDHLCFRVETDTDYSHYKNVFSGLGRLLIESPVGGRLISTYKLTEPIKYKNYSIDVIELPAPKPGKKTIDGFEHFEVVCDVSFDEIKKMYPHCEFDETGLKKDFNKELEILLGDYAIKFHHQSLEDVIEAELKK
jgi:uncharacterized protein